MCRYIYDLLLYQISRVQLQLFVGSCHQDENKGEFMQSCDIALYSTKESL